MAEILYLDSLGVEGLASSTLDHLRAAQALYHAQPEHPTYAQLRSLGLPVTPAPTDLPTDSVLVVPAYRTTSSLNELVDIVDRLLGPGGCPWDQEQTHKSLKRFLLEEAYEVCEAVDSGDEADLKEELGDLLLQPIMHAEMRRLAGGFDTEAVAAGIVDKLVRRHPHVFGDVEANTPDQVLSNWDKIKQSEKAVKPSSRLGGVPRGMASLLRAFEISKRAARAGFEWPNIDSVFDKLEEELAELHQARSGGSKEEIESELGDLLFTVVNIGRWLEVEPEEALSTMLDRFSKRFQEMESAAAKPLEELSPEEWDRLWSESKAREKR